MSIHSERSNKGISHGCEHVQILIFRKWYCCGARSKCGSDLNKDVKFCLECGASVGAGEKAEVRVGGAEAEKQKACFGPPRSDGGF